MSQESLGSLIKSRRIELDMTQSELGKILHVSDKAISKWERGVSYPDILKINDIARALDVSVSFLLEENKQEFKTEEELTVAGAIGTLLEVSHESIKRRKNTYIKYTIIFCIVACFVFVTTFLFFYNKYINTPFYGILQCVVVEKDDNTLIVKEVVAEATTYGVKNKVLSDDKFIVSCKDAVIFDHSNQKIDISDVSLECDVAIWYQRTRKNRKGEENIINAYQIVLE